jgi:hypothetical protein
VACRSGSPEWLTPLAISVAVNTNKEIPLCWFSELLNSVS